MRTLTLPLALLGTVVAGLAPRDFERPDDAIAAPGAAPDPIVSSFVYVGGCRVDSSDLDPMGNPSSANIAQLRQTLADLEAVRPRPDYWFFIGDLVEGLGTPATLETELAAWAKIYAASPIASMTKLVPVAGNHEMLVLAKAAPEKLEVSSPGAGAVWTRWVIANGLARGSNGPTPAPPNADALQEDESRLTYSFDHGAAHYIVLDTDAWTTVPDPATGSTQIGWVALHWLEADLAAAQANPAITGIYLFGHKPLIAPSGSIASDKAINHKVAPAIVRLLDATSKVKGYFTGHSHRWQAMQLPGERAVPQIIAGNGGSPVDPDWKIAAPYFGFTVVRTYASGKIGVVSYQRPAPTPYNAPTTMAAVAAPEIVIAR